MNALIAKEIRLIAPACGLALLLVVAPGWLLTSEPQGDPAPFPALQLWLLWFGAVLLALASFGREFGLQTFPLMLAQPLERTRFWWTKISVLAGALATVFAVWFLSLFFLSLFCLGRGPAGWPSTLAIGAAIVLATFAGGLWTTLLLRRVIAAFWLTLLIPLVIVGVLEACGAAEWMVVGALGLYAAAGFLGARWYFLRAQEVAWTGGAVALPIWRRSEATSSRRAYRPISALVGKEFQLHQVGLLGMACLVVLHLAVVLLRKLGQHSFHASIRSALEVFGGIWLLVPLLVGSLSVAEERKLDTMEGHLALTISRRVQFAIKLSFVLLAGGLLSAVLFWCIEAVGSVMGAGVNVGGPLNPAGGFTFRILAAICLGLALLGFYASTATRGVLAALGIGVVSALAIPALLFTAQNPDVVLGLWLWRGTLVYYIAWPTMLVAVIWLAFRNFNHASEGWALWRRNAATVVGALVFVAVITSAVYNRAWELLVPLESAHGRARLVGTRPARIESHGGSSLAALLPDGRVWLHRLEHREGPVNMDIKSIGQGMLPGSNWVDVAALYSEAVAIRSDGTLWVSDNLNDIEISAPRSIGARAARPRGPVQFGNETNWLRVIADYFGDQRSVTLLKQDGTLWRWSPSVHVRGRPWKIELRNSDPRQLGTNSDWARILTSDWSVYAWTTYGQAWSLHPPVGKPSGEIVIERVPKFDHRKWRCLANTWLFQAAVGDDGSLWTWSIITAVRAGYGRWPDVTPPVRIGTDGDWVAVAGTGNNLLALKSNGSLWEWRFPDGHFPPGSLQPLAAAAPIQRGLHHDWLAIAPLLPGTLSLAADGSLWHWWNRDEYRGQILAPSRRTRRIGNLFAGPGIEGRTQE